MQGSVPQLAFTYVGLFGITSSTVYPYSMHDSQSGAECKYDASTAVARVRGWEMLPRNNYDAVMDHLEKVGPLAVAVDASPWKTYNVGLSNNGISQ